jgi:hypothetical protein
VAVALISGVASRLEIVEESTLAAGRSSCRDAPACMARGKIAKSWDRLAPSSSKAPARIKVSAQPLPTSRVELSVCQIQACWSELPACGWAHPNPIPDELEELNLSWRARLSIPVMPGIKCKERIRFPQSGTMWRTALMLLIAALLVGLVPRAQSTPPKPNDAPRSADFRVVVWYRRDQPLETFKYQAYDQRKGEYTPAVDDWITLLRTKYPAYQVRVRNVFLDREKGATEALKVGSVIREELLGAAALQGVFLGTPALGPPTRPLFPRIEARAAPAVLGRPTPAGAAFPDRSYLNPPAPGFPVPVPYPRPHP